MKTSEKLAKELEVIAEEYDDKVDEIKARYLELLEGNENLIMDFANTQYIVGGERTLLVGDIMHEQDYPVRDLLRFIKALEILLENPKYYDVKSN